MYAMYTNIRCSKAMFDYWWKIFSFRHFMYWKMRPDEFWKFWYPTDAALQMLFMLWVRKVTGKSRHHVATMQQHSWSIHLIYYWLWQVLLCQNRKDWVECERHFFKKKSVPILGSMEIKKVKSMQPDHSLNKEILKSCLLTNWILLLFSCIHFV